LRQNAALFYAQLGGILKPFFPEDLLPPLPLRNGGFLCVFGLLVQAAL
jgi:hypothetical protein